MSPFKEWKVQPEWYRRIVIIFLSGLTLGNAAMLVKAGRVIEQMQSRMFTTAEFRMAAEQIVSELEDTSSVKSRLYQHVTDPDIHMSRSAKDSVYVTRAEYLELLQRNAVDDYNTMRAFSLHEQRQEETNAEIMRTQRLILDRLDVLTGQQ